MSSGRWTNPSQPQTLQAAVFLLYFHAALGGLAVLTGGLVNYLTSSFPWGIALVAAVVAGVLSARAIANEQRWGYRLAIGVAVCPFVFRILRARSANAALSTDLLQLLFEIALVALLLHPQSREYEHIWFK
jgi:hypothetical protein